MQRIADVIARQIDVAAIGPDDSFVELGADLIKALEVALALEKVFNLVIDPTDLLDDIPMSDIVEDMAAVVREEIGR